tara:strand:- start:282 stop:722 length:441 start_codon:yes stop_codon:yes gene_type:complete
VGIIIKVKGLESFMNFSKVGVLRFITIKIFFVLLFFGCKEFTVSKNELTFSNCKVFIEGELFSGEFEMFQSNKYILSKVKKGILKSEKTFMNEKLLTEKSFDSCNKGYQIIFNPNGKLNSEGYFLENKRVGLWKYYIKDSMYVIKY